MIPAKTGTLVAVGPVAPGSPPSFEDWMNRAHKGFFYSAWPCWNWRVGGVLVTLWLRNRVVKIYHDEGRATEWHPADTEMCRDAIATLLANNLDQTRGGQRSA